jgi:hypothetical protein
LCLAGQYTRLQLLGVAERSVGWRGLAKPASGRQGWETNSRQAFIIPVPSSPGLPYGVAMNRGVSHIAGLGPGRRFHAKPKRRFRISEIEVRVKGGESENVSPARNRPEEIDLAQELA